MKKIFNYPWNNLYNRYSIKILNNYNIVIFFWTMFLVYGCIYAQSGGGLVFVAFFFATLLFNIAVYTIILIVFILESKNIIKKRIKDSPKINNKFYKTISILCLCSVLLHYFILLILLFIDFALTFFEEPIRSFVIKHSI